MFCPLSKATKSNLTHNLSLNHCFLMLSSWFSGSTNPLSVSLSLCILRCKKPMSFGKSLHIGIGGIDDPEGVLHRRLGASTRAHDSPCSTSGKSFEIQTTATTVGEHLSSSEQYWRSKFHKSTPQQIFSSVSGSTQHLPGSHSSPFPATKDIQIPTPPPHGRRSYSVFSWFGEPFAWLSSNLMATASFHRRHCEWN